MGLENIEKLLEHLPPRHKEALIWFIRKAGTEQSWPKPLPDGTILATKAKGIYKPGWAKYALSVRQTLDGPYPDRDPVKRPDGTWAYSYYQENDAPEDRDSAYTNRGLIACWEDKVPVGVMRQTSSKPRVRYHILGLALVVGWDGGYFFLEGFGPGGYSRGSGSMTEIEVLTSVYEKSDIAEGVFDPKSIVDGRERAIASIVRRRGQPEFRRKLLELYGGRCAISDCDVTEALEAAHIVPYLGPSTNHPSNGLLLRADIHTLFDLGLIAIDSSTSKVIVAHHLCQTSYGELDGNPLRLPANTNAHPNSEALKQHRAWSKL